MAEAPLSSTTAPAPQGAGGLPQFDQSWWPGEMAWFAVIFLAVFILMAKVFVPRISGAITEREERISGDIARARALKEQAEAQSAAADAEIAQARAQAQKVAADAKAKAQAEASTRQASEEAKLNETLAKAEADIRASRDEAMSHVQEIAADTARAIVEKLSGQPASAADVAQALAARG
jgi:F-type H+-transporting ATPase subunit b